jgi:hypothetical protein
MYFLEKPPYKRQEYSISGRVCMNTSRAIVSLTLLLIIGCGSKKTDAPQQLPAAPADYFYSVASFKNNVSWSMDNAVWQPVAPKLNIQKGAYIETGSSSGAALAGSLGDIVMLGERTKVRLLIEELIKQSGGQTLAMRSISLIKGIAQFAVAKHKGEFYVETPSAKINVRGTTFTVSFHEETKATDVVVREGVVEVKDLTQPHADYSVDAGQLLTGIGTPSPIQRPVTRADSAAFAFVSPDDRIGPTGPVSRPAMSDSQARKVLENDSRSALPSVDSGRTASAAASPDNEQKQSQKALDSVRASHAAAAQAERDTFAASKARMDKAVDSERSSDRSALDKEREKFRKDAGGATGKADDAFDELEKRSGN